MLSLSERGDDIFFMDSASIRNVHLGYCVVHLFLGAIRQGIS